MKKIAAAMMMTTVKKKKNGKYSVYFVCLLDFFNRFFLLFDPNIFIKFHFAEELAPENHHICLNLFRSFLFFFFLVVGKSKIKTLCLENQKPIHQIKNNFANTNTDDEKERILFFRIHCKEKKFDRISVLQINKTDDKH